MNYVTDIYNNIIDEVHSSIVNEQFPKRLSLVNGMVGLLLYHSFHSELYSDTEERRYCQDLITEIGNLIIKSDKLDRNFFNGPLSFPYIVRRLAEMDILDYDQDLRNFIAKNLMRIETMNTVPSIIIGDRLCVGEALFLISLFDYKEDSLDRYSLQESIIASIDHCGRLLNEDVPPIYYRNEMSCQYLHSIYFFLQCNKNYGIYPTKVDKLLRRMDNLSKELGGKDCATHQQILRKLQGMDIRFSVDAYKTPDERLNSLAILGIYSFLYGIDIFKDFIHEVYADSSDKILHDFRNCDKLSDKILGIGIGLLICKFNDKKIRNVE